MPFGIVLWQAVVFFVLGWLIGQRFSHMHPVKAVNGQ